MPPSRLGLELTDRCNLACAHCLRAVVPPQAPHARDLDPGLARRLCAEASELGIPRVAMTGGETTLHPHFIEILDAASDARLEYGFVTNGIDLPALLPRILARPERRRFLRSVYVSLDGATYETHERIRGSGTFGRALAGIAVLRATGVPFSIINTVTRTNRHEIDRMGLLAHHLGAEQLFFGHFLPNGRPGATRDLDLTTAERHEAEHTIKRLMAALRLSIVMGEGYCTTEVDHLCSSVAGRTLYVDPDGHLTFCCELSTFHGEQRPVEERSDWIADLSKTSLREAIAAQQAAIARFRRERLAEEAAGRRTEDDKFACRFCVRHFGKPEREIVPLRRRRAI